MTHTVFPKELHLNLAHIFLGCFEPHFLAVQRLNGPLAQPHSSQPLLD